MSIVCSGRAASGGGSIAVPTFVSAMVNPKADTCRLQSTALTEKNQRDNTVTKLSCKLVNGLIESKFSFNL
jgi:hypothetical protein